MGVTTDYLGGWTFTAVGAGDGWNGPENVGLVDDNIYAAPAGTGATKWLAGTSAPPDLSEIPEGSTIDSIELSVHFQSPGFLFPAYRPLEIRPSIAGGGLVGKSVTFDANNLSGGGWKVWDQTPDGWNLTPQDLAAWLASPGLGLRCTGSGNGTIGVDAARLRVSYTPPPSTADTRTARIRAGGRHR